MHLGFHWEQKEKIIYSKKDYFYLYNKVSGSDFFTNPADNNFKREQSTNFHFS
jgi:hypothetical protein